MKNTSLQLIHQERKALYSPNGIFASIIKHYQWKGYVFQTISHPNNEEEQELIGNFKITNTSLEEFELKINNRFWRRTKELSWQSHFDCKLIPNQAVSLLVEKWVEQWLKLPMTPYINYKKGVLTYSIQFKEKPSDTTICEILQLIE